MKPRWQKESRRIDLTNFFALTGCEDLKLLRLLLVKFLLDLFDEDSMSRKGFTFAQLDSANHMTTVFLGKIVFIEFYFDQLCFFMSSVDEEALNGAFESLLSYVSKGIDPCSNHSDAVYLEHKCKLDGKIDAFLNLHLYKTASAE